MFKQIKLRNDEGTQENYTLTFSSYTLLDVVQAQDDEQQTKSNYASPSILQRQKSKYFHADLFLRFCPKLN